MAAASATTLLGYKTAAVIVTAAALSLVTLLVRHCDRSRRARLAFTDAHELCRMLKNGELRSTQLLEIFIERVERLDGGLNAVVVRDFERARAKARMADERREVLHGPLGALHGLPMTIKEELPDRRVTYDRGRPGDPACATSVATATCEAVARLEAAGAVIFGKTNVPVGCLDWQCYNPLYGATCNPWDTSRSPGGSSGTRAAFQGRLHEEVLL